MNKALYIITIFMMCATANAAIVNYGWEDGGTVLGTYGNVDAYNVGSPDPVHSGLRSLKLVDMSSTGPTTPQAYVAWITGLVDGDVIDASFWRYDTSPGQSPSVRIWAHYTDDLFDIDSYAGSASGNIDYGLGEGWDMVGYSWVFDDGEFNDRNGLVIEARTYSTDGDTVWLDDLHICAPDHATIHIVPEPATIVLLSLGGIMIRRKRKK